MAILYGFTYILALRSLSSLIAIKCYIFCCRNAYHGASPGTLGILAHNTWKLNVPLSFGFFQVQLKLCKIYLATGTCTRKHVEAIK